MKAVAVTALLWLVCVSSKRMDKDQINYMVKYGYMTEMPEGEEHSDEEMQESLMRFQQFNGMEETGIMDANTTSQMAKPRCGLKDILHTPSSVRARRYAFAGSRWSNPSLTYRYVNYSPDIPRSQTREAIEAAFAVWSEVTPLRFTEVTGDAVIYIQFQAGEHGDDNPFDGPSGTLAHAYFPASGIGGDAHFDESEQFSINGDSFNGIQGIDLFQVAAHEFGHSMGLAHSSDPNALMAPYYAGYIPNFKLPQDDIDGIQALYGPSPTDGGNPTNPPAGPMTDTPPVATPYPDNPGKPDSCNNNNDAISFLRTEMFIFQGEDLLRLEMRGSVISGYPRPASEFFYDLEANIDASYERSTDGAIMFFKGDQYWEYSGNNQKPNFPAPISNLGTLPNGIDATLSWGNTGYTYFFKGNQYWRYNEVRGGVDDNYPRAIRTGWPGVPNDLDAAFRWRDGNTYFVKGGQYWYFDTNLNQVDDTIYPRDFGEDWLNCPRGTGLASLTHYSLNVVVVAFLLAKCLRM